MNEISEAEQQDLQKLWSAINAAAETLRLAFEAIERVALYFAEMVQPELAEAIEWVEAETAQ